MAAGRRGCALSWRSVLAGQAWSRTAWVCVGELCGIVTVDCAVAAFGGGCAEGEGQAESKSKSEARMCESRWLCCVCVLRSRGGAKALGCGNQTRLGLDKRRSRLKALLGLSSSDGDVGADFDEAKALRIGRGGASSGSEVGDLGGHCDTGSHAQSGLASVRGVVGVPDARRSRARALLGLSSSDDAPVTGDADKGCKFGEFGGPRGDFSDGDGSCSADGKFSKWKGRTGGKFVRAPRRLHVDGADVPADAWKQFTPSSVNDKRCLARTWGGGRGAQCAKLPLPGRELCAQHHAELSSKSVGRTRGLVTGEIPRAKLLEFVRHASRREEKEFAVAVDAERTKQGHAPRRRSAQKLWYARYHFWREAERLFEGRDEDLRNISDLSLEDRKSCLLKTHEYFSRHPAFQMRGRGSGFVLLGKGPALGFRLR